MDFREFTMEAEVNCRDFSAVPTKFRLVKYASYCNLAWVNSLPHRCEGDGKPSVSRQACWLGKGAEQL